MKGKRVIAGILLVGILAVTLAGCKNTDNTKEETEKPVITLGSDSYPPYNYLNEDGVPTGIDVELATEAFKRMGYQVDVVQINWEKKKELVERGEIDCIMGCSCRLPRGVDGSDRGTCRTALPELCETPFPTWDYRCLAYRFHKSKGKKRDKGSLCLW